jgi:RNA recognition motif-containing protein
LNTDITSGFAEISSTLNSQNPIIMENGWKTTECLSEIRPDSARSPLSPFHPLGPPGRPSDAARIPDAGWDPWSEEIDRVGKKLYVGNLSYRVSSSDLEQIFSSYGSVQSAEVISDRDTGRSKGFGFVEMSSDAEARAAIDALHDQEHDGRRLTVNEARPREPRPGGGGGGGGGWRGGNGGGGGRGGRSGGYDTRRY